VTLNRLHTDTASTMVDNQKSAIFFGKHAGVMLFGGDGTVSKTALIHAGGDLVARSFRPECSTRSSRSSAALSSST
jgi:hypothetical protein